MLGYLFTGLINTLTSLNLAFNKLRTLPPEIGKLTSLTELYLDCNHLRKLPPEIGKLADLTSLDIRDNQLSTLPPELGKLTSLTKLYLGGNQLCELPLEIVKLTALKGLYLDCNRLRTLPSEFGKLSSLTNLALSYNQLSAMPPEIVKLVTLTELDLLGNKLSTLPPEIGKLTALTKLVLQSNKLRTLPPEIGLLTALTTLHLSSNQLSTLPPEIGKLTALQEIYLHDNPELGIPPTVLGPNSVDVSGKKKSPANPADILDYYFATAGKAGRALREVKVILVGRGEVGKSSMVDVLQKKKFVKNRKRTDGIAISNWEVKLKDGMAELLLWDFGGQEIMHGTHQFFLTHRSLYVVMVDGRHDRGRQDAEYWLKMVRAFGGDSPVLVVMNRQKEHPFNIDTELLARKYGVSLENFFRTDCGIATTIAPLRTAILREAQRMLKAEERFPVRCWDLKTRLGQMKEHGDDYLSQSDYEQLCEEHGITDEDAQQKLLSRLADLGTVVSFPDDVRMAELSVLNPAWATDGIYRVVTDEALREKKHGLLTLRKLRELLPKDRWPQPLHVRYVLDLMAKFNLCFPVDQDGDPVLVPELLEDKTPPLGDWKPSKCVVFQYNYPVLPHGVLPRFTTRTHEMSQNRLRWRSGVELAYEGAEARVQADYDANTITLWLRGGHAHDRRTLLKICRQHFHAIHGRIEGLCPQERVAVPGRPDVMVNYDDAVQDERLGETTFTVTINEQRVKVPIGDLLNGVESPAERRAETERIKPTRGGDQHIHYHMNDDHSIHIGGNVTNAQVGQTLTNCTNLIKQQASGPTKDLLEKLQRDARDLITKLPEDKQTKASTNLELAIKAVTSTPPERPWYDVSAAGLMEAAKYAKDFSGNIAGTLKNLGKAVIWPEA
jgi:internalin A